MTGALRKPILRAPQNLDGTPKQPQGSPNTTPRESPGNPEEQGNSQETPMEPPAKPTQGALKHGSFTRNRADTISADLSGLRTTSSEEPRIF